MMIVEAMASSLIGALLTAYPPIGCVIDVADWHGKKDTRNHVLIEPLDGVIRQSNYQVMANTDPGAPRFGFQVVFENWKLEYEMIGEFRFFVRGSKAAPLRRVKFTPKEPGDWTPTYYFVWDEPLRQAPAPRLAERQK